MVGVLRWFLAGFALLVAVVPPFLAFRFQYAHAKRFREVSPGRFYRSGQMTANGLREVIRRYGIKTVINLQHEDPDPLLADRLFGRPRLHESQLCRELGVRYVTLAPDLLPPDNRLDHRPPVVDEFLQLLDDPDVYPVLLHCRAGLHRTGRLTAIYRMEYEGWTHGQAMRELRAAGYGFVNSSEADDYIVQFVKNYQPRRCRTPATAPAPMPHVLTGHAKRLAAEPADPDPARPATQDAEGGGR